MRKGEQLDVFYENDPKLKEKAQKANFRVSILGGKAGAESARKLGHDLTEKFYAIQTGGYNMDTMKTALKGANEAIEEMTKNPETKKTLGQVYPFPKGITAERFAPDFTPEGEHIKTQVEENEMDMYTRLGKLNEHSSAVIMLPGNTGTEVELMANLHFDKKLKDKFKIEPKPLVLVGDSHINFVKDKFLDVVNKSEYIFKVENEDKALKLINILERLQNDDSLSKEERQELMDEKEKYLLRLEKENSENRAARQLSRIVEIIKTANPDKEISLADLNESFFEQLDDGAKQEIISVLEY